jgi:hypothetical protein
MTLTRHSVRWLSAILSAILAMAFLAFGARPAQAQHSFLHRHRTAAAIGAGLAAHHYAKKGAAARARSGRRPNFAERHPILSGLAAGAATHHILKKHH